MQQKLERVGGFLVILALASVFAWILGRRFPLIEYQPWTAIVIAAVGFAVILVAVQQERATTGRPSGTTNEIPSARGGRSTESSVAGYASPASHSQAPGSHTPQATPSNPPPSDVTASPSDQGPA
jgi:hypothetical protein